MDPEKEEHEKTKSIKKDIERNSRLIYMSLLKRNAAGASLSQIASFIEPKKTSPFILDAAIGKLIKDGLVQKISPNLYSTVSAYETKGQKTHEILIEKILSGEAIVKVDNELEARLLNEEYSGPQAMIRKNSRFRAITRLYTYQNDLYVKILKIIQKLD